MNSFLVLVAVGRHERAYKTEVFSAEVALLGR